MKPNDEPEQHYYQVKMQQEDEMLPIVAWLWGAIIMFVVFSFLWETAVKPLLAHLGIHID
jgi:hypothetical protein